MIRLLNKVPKTIMVACSGGVDSMAVLDFLCNSDRRVAVAHFNHGTAQANIAQEFVEDYCTVHDIPCVVGKIVKDKDPAESWEEYWRQERYGFLEKFSSPVVTAHHLDDVCEWWLFSSLHGKPALIPSTYKNIIRPFLCTAKQVFEKWCAAKAVPYFIDESNVDTRYMRNFIRHEMMQQALHVNPGLRKVLAKKILEENNEKLVNEAIAV